jgi:ABC-2 type transport system ATP-binding protein
VLSLSLQDMDQRFVALSHDAAVAEQMAAAHPLLRYRTGQGPGGHAALFDGEPPAAVQALGQRMRPSLVDLFVALTRRPELDRTAF